MFDLEEIARKEAALENRTETMWHLDDDKELWRSSRTTKPIQKWNSHASRNICSADKCSRRGPKKKNKMVVGQLQESTNCQRDEK